MCVLITLCVPLCFLMVQKFTVKYNLTLYTNIGIQFSKVLIYILPKKSGWGLFIVVFLCKYILCSTIA